MSKISTKEWLISRLKGLWNFIKILRVEPFLFLTMFQLSLKDTPPNQLIQDKICMNWYNTTAQYCRHLPTIDEHDDSPGHYKNRILVDVAQFGKTPFSFFTTLRVVYNFAGPPHPQLQTHRVRAYRASAHGP